MEQKIDSGFDWSKLRQLNAGQTLLAFLLPSAFAFLGFRVVMPRIIDNGYPKVLMWGIIASIMLLIFVIVGFFLNRREALTMNISIFKRFLVKKIGLKEWLICLGIMVIGILLSSGMKPIVEVFRNLPGLSIPDYMPFWLNPSIDPAHADIQILSPNYPLKGNYLVLVVMVITLLLNILAEEIYFRGWLLPKMQNFGKWSWVVNGTLFAVYHTFQFWLFPMILPLSLATALTVYLSKSILPAFVIHLVANFLISIIGIIALVSG